MINKHSFAVKLDTNQTNLLANGFIPMTYKDWILHPIINLWIYL